MSTTYSSTTKDASKDLSSTKDKDSTDTYVRSSDTTESSKTNTKGGKTTTFDASSDKSHDVDTSSYGFSKDTSKGQYGQQFGQRSQIDQDSNDQYRRGGMQQPSHPQMDVQQKLKEVGSLLQKAGQLLQDLQGSSAGDFQSCHRSSGGNYGGPFGGFEAQQRSGQSCDYQERLGGPCSYGSRQQQWTSQHPGQWSRPSGEWSQYESQQRGPMHSGGRWSEEREERGLSGRGYSNIEGTRGNVDRYGGFGGPNRPDLAYGQQYGPQQPWSGLGSRGGDREESISRRGGDRF